MTKFYKQKTLESLFCFRHPPVAILLQPFGDGIRYPKKGQYADLDKSKRKSLNFDPLYEHILPR